MIKYFLIFALSGCLLENDLEPLTATLHAPDTVLFLDDTQYFLKADGKCIFHGKMRQGEFQDEYLPWNLDQRSNPSNPESKITMCDSAYVRAVNGEHPIPLFGGE